VFYTVLSVERAADFDPFSSPRTRRLDLFFYARDVQIDEV